VWYLSAKRRFRSAPQLLALRNPSDRGRALLLQSPSRLATVVSVSDYRANTPYHLNEWRRLARCCPNLLAMDMPLHVDWRLQQRPQQEQPPSYSLAGAFPPSLRCLRICVPFQRNVVDLHDQLLEAICIEAPLLRRLDLIFPQTGAQLDLNALLRLKDSLTDLHIARTVTGAPRIDVLRQLHLLRKLDVGRGAWDLTDLALLCSPGHQLTRLQKLVLSHTKLVTVAQTRLLLSLPSLTSLEASHLWQPEWHRPSPIGIRYPSMEESGLRLVPSIPHLKRLTVACLYHDVPAVKAALPDVLGACRALTHLCLRDVHALKDTDLHALLAQCNRLRSLELREWTRMHQTSGSAVGYAWLSAAPPTLERLTIGDVRTWRAKDFLELPRLLPQLRALHVDEETDHDRGRMETQREYVMMRSLLPLRPPSLLWPSLRELLFQSIPSLDYAWAPHSDDPEGDVL
jgi:hypothetical protein